MRPGRLHPGNAGIRTTSMAREQLASMRPGRLHPGNRADPGVAEGRHGASMRPGRLHPGNYYCQWHIQPDWLRFNEAGASPPRKSLHVGRCGCGYCCFNEAGASPPRKWCPYRRAASPVPCFNEAGASPPRKSSKILSSLMPVIWLLQ